MFLKEYGKVKSKLLGRFAPEPAHNADFGSNGEERFLKFVSALPVPGDARSIVDVGANIGEWTAAAVAIFAQKGISKFYCVEPIPSYAAQIETRFAGRADVVLIREIFSQRAGGETEIFEIAGGGRLYQSYRGNAGTKPAAAPSAKVAVPHKVAISSGDKYFSAGAEKPYLVKIDCDGHDLHVLSGFRETLQRARPLVQFEYSDFWIAGKARLRDACALLRACRYRTYKLFPDRLVAFTFNPMFETFAYQNIVAIPDEFSPISGASISFR